MCILSSTPLQFGMKAFYRRHEEVIAEVILQRDVCEGTGCDWRESGPRHRQETLQGEDADGDSQNIKLKNMWTVITGITQMCDRELKWCGLD